MNFCVGSSDTLIGSSGLSILTISYDSPGSSACGVADLSGNLPPSGCPYLHYDARSQGILLVGNAVIQLELIDDDSFVYPTTATREVYMELDVNVL